MFCVLLPPVEQLLSLFSDSQGADGLFATAWEVHHFLFLVLRLSEKFNVRLFSIAFPLLSFFFPPSSVFFFSSFLSGGVLKEDAL